MNGRLIIATVTAFQLVAGLGFAHAAVYHLDSHTGDDGNSGTSPKQAWRSLERANSQRFQPGDTLLLKAGTRYSGPLKPQGSGILQGSQALPITINSYGDGPKPRIDAAGHYPEALLLQNLEFWEINNLEITNLGTNREPWRTGVRVVTDGFGTMRHVYLRNLFVHDVNGDLSKDREGCGIYFESRGGNDSRFDDLRIEDCHVVRADRNGICQRTSNGTRSLQVVIRRNLLEDIGGDGIKIWGSNGALVEWNVLRGGRTRCDDGAAGIWPFEADDTVIQFNEVSGMKGIKDGQGFDSDWGCRRSLFQHNYSHDNEGGFFLICAPGSSFNEGTVIRYNISQNDGINTARVFHFGGGAKNTKVYNNTVYLGPTQDLPLILFEEWEGGNADTTWFSNNIFYVDGRASFAWGKGRNTVFEHNIFFGRFSEIPTDPYAVTNRPALANPGTGGNGFGSLSGYRLSNRLGAILGRIVADNGARDFYGAPVHADKPPAVGACELAP